MVIPTYNYDNFLKLCKENEALKQTANPKPQKKVIKPKKEVKQTDATS